MAKRSSIQYETLREKALADPEVRAEYEAFRLQLKLARELKQARQKAHLTQEKVAEKMETQKPVVARIEAAGGKGKHSPSIRTLVKYASAIGFILQIRLIPQKKSR